MNQTGKKSLIALIAVTILVAIDQWSKSLVSTKLALHEAVSVIDGVFQIRYIRNSGMAWSMFEGKQVVFCVITPIIVFFLIKEFICLPGDSKYTPIRVLCVFLTAGAIGNLIDRIWGGEELFAGSVVDFFDFCLINFPVFNVADIYVTCSVIALFLFMFFKYKDEDFEVIINSCTKFKKGE